MLDWIIPFVNDAPPRTLPAYQLFLKSQRVYIREEYLKLWRSFGYEAPGMRMLRYVLQFVDFDYLDACANNYERYSHHLRFLHDSLTDITDPLNRGKGFQHLFFRKHPFSTEEYVITTADLNTIVNLPLWSDNWKDWKNIRPVRFWSADTPEFSLKFINDQQQYAYYHPTYAVILLDVVGLILKYYTWFKQVRPHHLDNELILATPQQYFLHKYVLCYWLWDSADIWLINILAKLLRLGENVDLRDFTAQSLEVDQQYGRIALNCGTGFNEVYKLISSGRTTVRPETILSSKLLFTGSINDRVRLSEDELATDSSKQYEWLQWLKDKQLMELFINIWMCYPGSATYKRMIGRIKREGGRMLNRRPWQNCNNAGLKYLIEHEMEHYVETLHL